MSLSVLLALGLLAHRWAYPSVIDGTDARAYQDYATALATRGLHVRLGSVRTYGYPAFLAIVRNVTGGDGRFLALSSGVIQYALYLAGVVRLVKALARFDRLWGWAVLGGLLVNPFTVSIVTDSLTEGLSVAIYAWLCAICVTLPSRNSARAVCLDVIVGTLAASYATEVRPSNVSILVAWMLGLCWLTLATKVEGLTRGRRAFVTGAAAFVGLCPLLPQMAYNAINYRVPSPLPICDLSRFQAQFGVMLLKYDTIVRGTTAAGWFFPNPLFHAEPEVGLHWYVSHPLRGLATAVIHIFAAVEPGNLFTYVREMSSFGTAAVTVGYSAVNVIGIMALASMLVRLAKDRRSLPPRLGLLVIFLLVSQSASLAVVSVAAVEARFGVLVGAVVAVCAVRYVLGAVTARRLPQPAWAVVGLSAFAVVTSAGFALAHLGSDTPVRPVVLEAASTRCEM